MNTTQNDGPSPERATSAQVSELQKRVAEATERLVRAHNLACEDLTEQQLASVIRQACQCGDLRRLVSVNGAQQVIYIPFDAEQRQRARIERLEAALKKHGITDPDETEIE